MRGILDRVAGSMTFMRAEVPSDVVAIEMARRLEDVASLHRYQRYTRKLPLAAVLDAWMRASSVPRLYDRAECLKAICEARLRGEEVYG